MAARKETTQQIMLQNGNTLNVVVRDGIIIDDILVQAAKAEGYRVVSGRDVFPEITRKTKDYLIKLGVIAG